MAEPDRASPKATPANPEKRGMAAGMEIALKFKAFLCASVMACVLAAPALATGQSSPAGGGGTVVNATSVQAGASARANSRSVSRSNAGAVGMGGAGGAAYGGSGGAGGIGGTGGAGGSGGVGNSVTNNVGGPGEYRYGGSYTVHNNPDLAALVASTANVCAKPAGGTTSFLGVGLGALFTPESDRCNRRLDAAALAGLGRSDAALLLLQETEEVRAVVARADAARPAPLPVKPAYCTEKPRESAAERYMRLANC